MTALKTNLATLTLLQLLWQLPITLEALKLSMAWKIPSGNMVLEDLLEEVAVPVLVDVLVNADLLVAVVVMVDLSVLLQLLLLICRALIAERERRLVGGRMRSLLERCVMRAEFGLNVMDILVLCSSSLYHLPLAPLLLLLLLPQLRLPPPPPPPLATCTTTTVLKHHLPVNFTLSTVVLNAVVLL
jgi:hypothetical protein